MKSPHPRPRPREASPTVTPAAPCQVCALGSRAREMYFISKGTVTVHGAEGQVLKALHSGEFFGELGLLHDTRRSADVVAVTYVDTFLLTRVGFTRSLEDHPEQLEQIRQAATSSLHNERSDDEPLDAARNELAGERLSQTAVRRYLHDNAVYEDSVYEDSAQSLQQSLHELSQLSSGSARRARPSREGHPSGCASGCASTYSSGRFLDRLRTPMGTLRSLRSARGTARSLASARGGGSMGDSAGSRHAWLDALRPRHASCGCTGRGAAPPSLPPPSLPPLSLQHMASYRGLHALQHEASSTALLASELYAEPLLHTASALERHVHHRCPTPRCASPRPAAPRPAAPRPAAPRPVEPRWAAFAHGSSSNAQPPPPAPPPPPPLAPLSPDLPKKSKSPEGPSPEPALSELVVPERSSPQHRVSSPQRSSLRQAASPEHCAPCATVHEGEVSPHDDGVARGPPSPRLSFASSYSSSEREPPELPEQLAADGLVLAPPRTATAAAERREEKREERREEHAASSARLDAAMRRLEDRVVASIATTLGGRIDALAAELASLRAQLPERR